MSQDYSQAIKRFSTVLKEKQSIDTRPQLAALEKEVYARLQVRHLRTTGKNCDDKEKLVEWIGNKFDEFIEPFHERARKICDDAKIRREELGAQLLEIATGIELFNSQVDSSIIYTVCESTYSTQGFGACAYAKGRAEIYADECMYLGVSAGVEQHTEDKLVDYHVWVSLQEIECEILKVKISNEVPMKETVRFCLRRYLNPRVYWQLPWGYEETNKLGMRGEDLTL